MVLGSVKTLTIGTGYSSEMKNWAVAKPKQLEQVFVRIEKLGSGKT